NDFGLGIAVDGSGNAYVVGQTQSNQTTFPVAIGPDLTFNGGFDAFVAKVNAAGTALDYAGYIGGEANDLGFAVAVDSSGSAYVTGSTGSSEFPVAVGPDLTPNGLDDAFVAKVKADGTGLEYAGYIGGSANDSGRGIAVDGSGNAYITGTTLSDETTFPVVGGPDPTPYGYADVDPDGDTTGYADEHAHRHSDGHPDSDPDGDSNADADGYAHGHPDGDLDSVGHADGHADFHSDRYADVYAHPRADRHP